MSAMQQTEGPDDDSEDAPRSDADRDVVGTENSARSDSWAQRLLDNKTGLQRAVISLGAFAAALVAIGGVVTAVVRVVNDDGTASRDLGAVPENTVRIESGTKAADEFVHALDEHDGGVVALDHQVIATKGPTDVRLQYDCTDTGVCVMVRVQDIDVEATDMSDGLWFAGCFAVLRDGAGYGYEPLDMELRYQGETCP